MRLTNQQANIFENDRSTSREESCHLTTRIADKPKVLAISTGLFLIALGLMAIFAFSTQILVPAQPATPGHYEGIGGRVVWRAGQPSQPEHFEMPFPNLTAGLSLILAGLAISAWGLLFHKRKENDSSQ
jgi:hypothetical protein